MPTVERIREAIIAAIPYTTSNDGQPPDARGVYVPPSHLKALRLESSLVVGARGVGKSFWTAALGSPPLRAILGTAVRELEHTQVHIGFALAPSIAIYPNADVFAHLLAQGFRPGEVWRAVVVRWLAPVTQITVPVADWASTTAWVRDHPEPLAQLMEQASQHFRAQNQQGLIVFDALDRTSPDWRVMDNIVRDLLQLALWLKAYPALHAKVFLREDQFARTVTDFPDASKLLATKAELIWYPHDLHGLLWQLLCNAPDEHGKVLRELSTQVLAQSPTQRQLTWSLPDDARRDGVQQRALFAALAGDWMGTDKRRGVPYVWSVSHLADGKGRTSPRSFQVAIRAAAEDSAEKHATHSSPLHYESIKRGVQKASEIRIAEVAEDYPWITKLLQPLRGVTVPCEFSVVEERWNQEFPQGLMNAFTHDRLPPQHAERGWPGVREDLERLGLLETMKDGRVNMPDLYRVGFGLGRRGGVKPMK